MTHHETWKRHYLGTGRVGAPMEADLERLFEAGLAFAPAGVYVHDVYIEWTPGDGNGAVSMRIDNSERQFLSAWPPESQPHFVMRLAEFLMNREWRDMPPRLTVKVDMQRSDVQAGYIHTEIEPFQFAVQGWPVSGEVVLIRNHRVTSGGDRDHWKISRDSGRDPWQGDYPSAELALAALEAEQNGRTP